MKKKRPEKRVKTRYLCHDGFTNCTIFSHNIRYPMTAINFHRDGIALFSDNRLDDLEPTLLEFDYLDKKYQYHIGPIPLTIVYANEMDIGCQYGCQFGQLTLEDKQQLEKIEQALATIKPEGGRYGVF